VGSDAADSAGETAGAIATADLVDACPASPGPTGADAGRAGTEAGGEAPGREASRTEAPRQEAPAQEAPGQEEGRQEAGAEEDRQEEGREAPACQAARKEGHAAQTAVARPMGRAGRPRRRVGMRCRAAALAFTPMVALLLGACRPGKGSTAYIGATLWDGTGGPPLRDAVIVVDRTGHIGRVGAVDTVAVPRGATVRRLNGKWIIPGLIDAHARAERWTLARFLAYGVTALRDVGGSQDSSVALGHSVSLGGIAGPRLYISGATIDRAPATWPAATAVTTTEEARQAVDERVLINASQAQVGSMIDSTLLANILDEATTLKLPVMGHLGAADAVTAARLGIAAIDHLSGVVQATVANPAPIFRAHEDDFFAGWNLEERTWATLDSARLRQTAETLQQAGVAIVPTLALHELWAHLEDSTYLVTLDLAGVPQPVQNAWDVPDLIARAQLGYDDYFAFRTSRPVQDRFVRLYHRLGGLVAAGSDAGVPLLAPGSSLHDELRLLVAAGFTPRDALLAATRDGARLLHADSIGVVREGGVADFVILSANPLEAIGNTREIDAVVSRGAYRTEAELRAMWR
jgi:imidazolonepropionase-like amidohydrolase